MVNDKKVVTLHGMINSMQAYGYREFYANSIIAAS